jgi:hypothetical protein
MRRCAVKRGPVRSSGSQGSPREARDAQRKPRAQGGAKEGRGELAEAGMGGGTSFEQVLLAHSVFLKSGRAEGLRGRGRANRAQITGSRAVGGQGDVIVAIFRMGNIIYMIN